MTLLKKTYYFTIKRVGMLSLGLLIALPAYAISNPLGQTKTFGELINKIADIVVAIGIPIAAVFIVYAGFLFVSARGSEEQITKAKGMFYWTVIGTMLVVGAKVIAQALEATIKSL